MLSNDLVSNDSVSDDSVSDDDLLLADSENDDEAVSLSDPLPVPGESSKPSVTQAPSPSVQPSESPELSSTPSPSVSPSESPKSSPSPSPSTVPSESPKPSPIPSAQPSDKPIEDQDDSVEKINITIKAGDSSYSAAKKLQTAGIVESAALFDEYLCKNGYDKYLVVGTHAIPKNATDEEIAKIITSKKK